MGLHEPMQLPRWLLLGLLAFGTAGCAMGPRSIDSTRIAYNRVLKTTSEEQLLLNIVRLRYADTPSSLAVSSIAAQFEMARSAQLTPFLAATGAGASTNIERFRSILPQAMASSADRPTISYTPLDDGDFTRRLFTPLGLEQVLYLAKTTWPIATVFRLYLENLNWVPNAQLASGPTPKQAPEYEEFLAGIKLLQVLQDKGLVVFGSEERSQPAATPIETARVAASDLTDAAKNGLEYRRDPGGRTWSLIRKTRQPVLHVKPTALAAPEVVAFTRAFHLKPGLLKYDVTLESLVPFTEAFPREGVEVLDLETRSLLQVLYFLSHGVDIPDDHAKAGLVQVTRDARGHPFDWHQVLAGLFRVHSSSEKDRPPGASVATRYQNRWFFIDQTDQDTKSTFSLVLELSRLEMTAKTNAGPALTLSVGQ